jgi:fermentation-respiration switch protein FrsA (DUF1100 family)
LSRKFIIATAATVFVGGPLCFLLIGAAFCSATLHVHKTQSPAPPNAATVSLVAGDTANLSAWWLAPQQPNENCVLVLHGIGDSRTGSLRFAPMFLNDGYAVLMPDSRGHGASEGQFVTYGLLEKYDVIAWANWMKRSGCRKVFALGESLGASILIQSAAIQPVFSAIVAECPFADLRAIAEYRVGKMLGMFGVAAVPLAKVVVNSAVLYAHWVDRLNLDEVSPLQAIAHASTPILLVHGLQDSQTPYSNSEGLAKVNPQNPLWLVPNAWHIGAAEAAPDEFRSRVLGWFARH